MHSSQFDKYQIALHTYYPFYMKGLAVGMKTINPAMKQNCNWI